MRDSVLNKESIYSKKFPDKKFWRKSEIADAGMLWSTLEIYHLPLN